MTAPFFACVDWQRPWLAHLRGIATRVLEAPDWRCAINAIASEMDLSNHRGLPIHFVPQSCLPADTAYEQFISATGGVPTRDNLHDFFNALIWLTFPKIKIQLNALQAAEIERREGTNESCARRGAVRDAATIFDENAALLVVRDETLIVALREHRWHEVFVTRRQDFVVNCELWLFGHALMEKLVLPFKAITAHALPLIAGGEYCELSTLERRTWLDAHIASKLDRGLSASDFTPLPVLGIPGWSDGQTEDFYSDVTVFRPKRKRT